ncbi:MAG: CCA tRNA nucleotidyltransferase [Ignavibacteria bacterium]|nr:CCA tRNA nucleotidyltransferase [Ignavibacteria bacterium]
MNQGATLEITDPLLKQIGEVGDRNRIPVYVVGGYVRDLLLGKEVKDIDIVIEGDGMAFTSVAVKELNAQNVVRFERFGTAMFTVGSHKLEVVGARVEAYERGTRKPSVRRGTIQEDLARRDFTVNAIAVSLNRNTFGEIHDPFDGRSDIGRRELRCPLEPVHTFDDDPLRILRAFRFASQLSFEVETETLAAVPTVRNRLKIVSQERKTEELMKIIGTPRPSVGLRLMFDHGVMQIVFPEVARMAGIDQRRDFHHKDVFLHTCEVVDNVAAVSDNVWLRFASLVHDIAKPRTKAFKPGIGWTFHGHEELGARMMKGIFRRLKLPLDHLPYVEKLVRLHLRPMVLVDQTVTDSAVRRLVFEAGPEIDDLMVLCRADITSKNPKLVKRYLKNYDVVMEKIVEVEEKDRLRNWQPPVKGDEIMEVCGLKPGKEVGILKKAIEEAILEGEIPNEHDAALAYLLKVRDSVLRH